MFAEVFGNGVLASEKAIELRRRSGYVWQIDLSTEAADAKFRVSIR